ncbi:MAG: hypothetical protein ACTSQF_04450 [Candidatus Heimdallarchaeaceae archaeon]
MKSMLHNIWIAKDTGECLFHKRYGSIDHDENLITSFLSAIEIFAQNVDKGCDFLQTKNYKFIYSTSDQIVSVICTDCDDEDSGIRSDLKNIQDEFNNRFEEELRDWNGRVEHFSQMNDYVDKHLKKYSTPTENLANTKLELNPKIITQDINNSYSRQQKKVISLLKYKGVATLNDIVKLMKLTETDAQLAAKDLLNSDVIRQIPIS